AFEVVGAETIGPVAFGDPPLHALVVDDDLGHALAVLRIDAGGPEIDGLVGVRIRGHDEVLLRIVGARGARPSRMARSRETPHIGFVHDHLARAHAILLIVPSRRTAGPQHDATAPA